MAPDPSIQLDGIDEDKDSCEDTRENQASPESQTRRSQTRRGLSVVVNTVSFVEPDVEACLFGNREECHQWMAELLESPYFNNGIGFVILLNAVTIGLESSAKLEGWQQSTLALEVVENVFLCIYVFELSLRLFVHQLACFESNWVKFDGILVVSGVITQWVLSPIGVDAAALGPVMVLRLMRLLRLIRTLRLIITVKELWLLVRSLLNSAGTMIYTMGLLLVILYIFACISIELISLSTSARGPDADPEFQELVAEYFPTVFMAMVTLVQFVCFDSISGIYKPFIQLDPNPPLLALYFSFAIVVIGIVLMNLVTAVIVNSALEQASHDKDAALIHHEQERKELIVELRKMFERVDTDKSGNVTLEEMQQVRGRDKAELIDASGMSDPLELFEALDATGNGVLSIDDFCESMVKMSTSHVPLEVQRVDKQVKAMRAQLQSMHDMQLELLRFFKEFQNNRGGQPAGVHEIRQKAAPDELKVEPKDGSKCEDAPVWAHEMLDEFRQLRSECLQLAEASRQPRCVPLGSSRLPVGSLRDIARDVARNSCAISSVEPGEEQQDIPLMGRRLGRDLPPSAGSTGNEGLHQVAA